VNPDHEITLSMSRIFKRKIPAVFVVLSLMWKKKKHICCQSESSKKCRERLILILLWWSGIPTICIWQKIEQSVNDPWF
jgi:hypothetical protein